MTGSLSHRLGRPQSGGLLVSGTGPSFARQPPQDFAECDLQGEPKPTGNGIDPEQSAPRPSKETAFHAAIYRTRLEVCAVLHLQATDSLTLSCLAVPAEEGNVLPVHSSYAVTCVGWVPLLVYLPPGSVALAQAVERSCRSVQALRGTELLDANARATHAAAISPGQQRPRLLPHVQGWTA